MDVIVYELAHVSRSDRSTKYIKLILKYIIVFTLTLSPTVDNIWALVLVWRIRGKIIRTALCCVVYNSCAQWYTHTCEQFLRFCMLVRLKFFFVYLFGVCLWLFFLCLLRSFHSCIACFCCVGFSFFSTKPRDWLGRTSLKWPILCRVWFKTLI